MNNRSLRSLLESTDGKGRDLVRALIRLTRGKPSEPDLKQAAASGRLRITYSSVAQEAKCSRSLIGYKHCAYPEIRTAIKEIMDGPHARNAGASSAGGGRTADKNLRAEDIINGLRHENRVLKGEKQALATRLMTALVQMRELEKKLDRERKKQNRNGQRLDPNRVVGRNLDVNDEDIIPADDGGE